MQYAKGRLAEAFTGPAASKLTDLGYGYTMRGENTDVYESTPNSGGYFHISQTYWPDGIPPSLLSGIPGVPSIQTGVDGEGRVKQMTAASGKIQSRTFNYNSASLPTSVTLGSQDYDSLTYDPNTLRMTQFQFNIGATPQSLTGGLTWNANAT